MNKQDIKVIKNKILKCLTEEFTYGKTKKGAPLKRPHKNQPVFDKKEGWAVFCNIELDDVMNKVVLGIYFAFDDLKESDNGK